MSHGRVISVKLGGNQASTGESSMHCGSVGSGVAVCLFDPISHVGGVSHIMLPRRPSNRLDARAGIFADSALPELVESMEELGAQRSRLIATVAGGAEMLNIRGDSAGFDMGSQNAKAVLEVLAGLEIPCQLTEVGGSQCRSLDFPLDSGKVQINVFSISKNLSPEAVAA
jgi:chemotaxis protein CheD